MLMKRMDRQIYKIILMILLSIATLIFIALLANNFLKLPHKLILLSTCVSLLVVVNFLNQIQANQEPKTSSVSMPNDQPKLSVNQLDQYNKQEWKANDQDQIWEQLIQDEKNYATILIRAMEQQEHSLFYFQGLHQKRVKLLIDLLLHKAKNIDKLDKLKIFRVNFEDSKCNIFCLQNTFDLHKDAYNILIVEDIEQSQDLSNIESIYIQKDVTVIFQTAGRSFRYNSLHRLVQHHIFPNNYISKFIGHYSSKHIEHCLSQRTLDYQFYTASQHIPLEELCSREQQSSQMDRCIYKLTMDRNDPVPVNWVRKCFQDGNSQTANEHNGWIYPKKGFGVDKVKLEESKGQL